MFSDLEEYCTIGRPKGQLSGGDVDSKSACLSKIGGIAQFHDVGTSPSVKDVQCRVCQSSNNTVLVAQIYAPLDFHRTLYVYGCNNNRCSYDSRSWTVIRNQSKDSMESGSNDHQSKPTNVVVETKKSSTDSNWDMSSFGQDVAVKKQSTLDDDSDSEDDLADLMAMIAQRDNAAKTTDKPVAVEMEVTVSASAGSLVTSSVLPCWRIAEVDEDWTKYDEINDDEQDNDEEEEESGEQQCGVVAKKKGKSAADAHIEQLLQSYLSTEDDAEVLNVFQSGGAKVQSSSGGAGAAGKGQAKKKAGGSSNTGTHSDATGTDANKNDGDGGDDEDVDEEETSEVKLSRSSDRARVEEYFLRRVSRYPSQVLRYAYGGQPLWITAPSRLHSGKSRDRKSGSNSSSSSGGSGGNSSLVVPCCELCGADRVFECQLMPGLLSYVSTDKGASSNTSGGSSSGAGSSAATSSAAGSSGRRDFKSSELFSSGLDFGVVAIYSCPNSCAVENSSSCSDGSTEGSRIAREVAIVQMPPDVIDLY